jgi:hypothetical protein
MALAEYFSKNLLAISQVLKNGNSGQFQSVLNNTVIGIAFNKDALKHEGKAALDLTVRLVARLYPKIKFIDLNAGDKNLVINLKKLASSINSRIEFVEEEPTLIIVIGNSAVERIATQGAIYYIGSNAWVAKFSPENPLEIGESTNPLGAGVAACIGASNIFRYVFADFLQSPECDDEFSLSLITLNTDDVNATIKTKQLDIGKIHLIGLGAIGNGFIWALSNAPFLKGTVTIIEPETLALSNLQRYVLAEEKYIGKAKLQMAKDALKESKVDTQIFNGDWAAFLNKNNDWKQEMVVVAIDNANDRIGIQTSLPNKIINAYTENNVIGISRHFDFGNDACLVCMYMPTGKRKSHSQEVADNLNLTQNERFIRDYIFYNKNADEQLLTLVANANNIEIEKLEMFKGMPVQEFYSNVVCGGMLMELRNGDTVVEHIEAPLAFQSAMAGILELAEVIIDKAGLRKEKMQTKTQLYPLSPIKQVANPYNHSLTKDTSGRCICADADFLNAYKNKWS